MLAGTVIVTIPSDVSHLVVRKSITVAAQAPAPILGLVENMTGMFRGPAGVDLAREAGVPFLGSVPFDPELARAADRGEAFVAAAPTRDSARALQQIARAVQASLTATRA
jgi:MinD-like ATPase involved in chromosome partitioning or flagellar assembly